MPHITAFDYKDDTDNPSILVFLRFSKDEAPAEGAIPKCEVEWRPGFRPNRKEELTKTLSPVDVDPDDGILDEIALLLPQKYFRGEAELTFTWTPKDASEPAHFNQVIPLGNSLNTQQNRPLNDPAPEISLAINAPLTSAEASRVPTASPPSTPEEYGVLIEAALKTIHANLQAGLGNFWPAPECRESSGRRALSELDDTELDALSLPELDECWAQLVSEMFVGTAYIGPGFYMNANPHADTPATWDAAHRKDSTYFRMVRSRAIGEVVPNTDGFETGEELGVDRSAELVCALMYCCQQLSTATLMTRSMDFHDLAEDPLDCAALPHGKLAGKFAKIVTVQPASGLALDDKRWLAPGACYFVNEWRHVGIVLRAFRSTRIQLLDAGGWNVGTNPFSQPTTDPPTVKNRLINWDTIAATTLENGRQTFSGVFLPPPITESNKQKLISMIKLLKKARPLGVVRLVVYDRTDSPSEGTLRYVSPRLRMHEGDKANIVHYPITRLFAALRGCPHADVLDVRLQVFSPSGNPALRNACNNGRARNWWLESADHDKIAEERRLTPTLELSVSTTGRPRFHQRSGQGLKKQANFPAYLEGFNDVTVRQLDPTSIPRHAVHTTFPELAKVREAEIPDYFRRLDRTL